MQTCVGGHLPNVAEKWKIWNFPKQIDVLIRICKNHIKLLNILDIVIEHYDFRTADANEHIVNACAKRLSDENWLKYGVHVVMMFATSYELLILGTSPQIVIWSTVEYRSSEIRQLWRSKNIDKLRHKINTYSDRFGSCMARKSSKSISWPCLL